MRFGTATTGIESLDAVLDGLIAGDNVVWIGDRDGRYEAIEHAFLTVSAPVRPTIVIVSNREEARRVREPGIDVVDASKSSPFGRGPVALADEIDRLMSLSPPMSIVVDGLDDLCQRWGSTEGLRFFSRMCPSMLQSGAITYWRITRSLGAPFVNRVRQVTQCLLELTGDRLRVLKAESRDDVVQGAVHRITMQDGELVVSARTVSGRLARGLSTVRKDLGLTQAQLAQAAGVTSSAMSQAENGARGLSVDTLMLLADRLGVSLDRLVDARPPAGYQLARHDRRRTTQAGVIALADDSLIGLRAFLVVLDRDESGVPPIAHRGVELVAAVRGLVQVDVGDDTPVLRAGDTLLAGTSAITGWRNLRPEAAAFYWVLRD